MGTRIGIDARLIRAYGIGSYIRGLLHGLASLGGDEEYVVFAPGDARALVPPSMELVVSGVAPHTLGEPLRMGRAVDRARLDLVHAAHFNVPATGLPLVVTLYDAIPFHYRLRNPIAFAYIAFMMQTAVRRGDRLLAISHAAKRDIVDAVDCDPERIHVIHIGIGEQFFTDGAAATDLGRYFLFVGRAVEYKNVAVLLEALKLARRADPALRVVLTGGQHEGRGNDGVIVPGYVEEARLLELYRGAIAVVMPSLMEGFGLPPLEGMALGTPAITSNAPALVEVTGDAALHFDATSKEQLAEAMLRLAGDERLCGELARRGRERAQRFSWRRCAEETRAVYRELLSR